VAEFPEDEHVLPAALTSQDTSAVFALARVAEAIAEVVGDISGGTVFLFAYKHNLPVVF
jgi:hypothetical protein